MRASGTVGELIGEEMVGGKRLTVWWSPFDHIEKGAKLAVVGITPGCQQKTLADQAYQAALRKGSSKDEASRKAKFAASFGGKMRTSLIRMMDLIGASRFAGLASFSNAFDEGTCAAIHFTSALRYPVFEDDQNYNRPPLLRGSTLLRSMVDTYLRDEVEELGQAIWQPLGDKPDQALRHLVSLGVLRSDRLAPPLPHPSGANAERIKYFLGEKSRNALSDKCDADKLDKMRDDLITFYRRVI